MNMTTKSFFNDMIIVTVDKNQLKDNTKYCCSSATYWSDLNSVDCRMV